MKMPTISYPARYPATLCPKKNKPNEIKDMKPGNPKPGAFNSI